MDSTSIIVFMASTVLLFIVTQKIRNGKRVSYDSLLEKINSKEKLAYDQKLLRDQRKLMDELASMRYARKM